MIQWSCYRKGNILIFLSKYNNLLFSIGVCFIKKRLYGAVGGVKEACQAEEVGDVETREEGPEIGQVGGDEGGLDEHDIIIISSLYHHYTSIRLHHHITLLFMTSYIITS